MRRLAVALGQLTRLPVTYGRSAERRIVNLAARLREHCAKVAAAEIQDLSVRGFSALIDIEPEPGSSVWLKLPGLEPQNSRVVWYKEGKGGFEFATPLHAATLDQLASHSRRNMVRGHFGAQG